MKVTCLCCKLQLNLSITGSMSVKLGSEQRDAFRRKPLKITFSGNPYWRGSISTVDLLSLSSSDQLLFMLKRCFSFSYKTTNLNLEVKCTNPSPSIRIPRVFYCFHIILWINYNNYPSDEGVCGFYSQQFIFFVMYEWA